MKLLLIFIPKGERLYYSLKLLILYYNEIFYYFYLFSHLGTKTMQLF